jgi:hypothetical protein
MRRRYPMLAGLLLVLLAPPSEALAEMAWGYGGFLESRAEVYPQRPHPADTHALALGHAQLWIQGMVHQRLSWRTSGDLRLDTHDNVDRHRWLDLSQRGLQQPAGALRELYVTVNLGSVDVRLGKQEIRWGRADGFNPTDNLVPYDYLNIVAEERIPVPAAKMDVYIGDTRLEAAWIPWFTPTRLPLLNQRWFPRLPTSTKAPLGPMGEEIDVALAFDDGRIDFPARTLRNGQWGVRWNQVVGGGEFSLSYFDGFDDLPVFRPTTAPQPLVAVRPQLLITLDREYHRMRVFGADYASALGPFGVRGELAYFDVESSAPLNRDRLVFVIGLDRTWGDWFAIVQYTDQIPARDVQDALVFPDQGLRSAILYRIERTLSGSQSIEIKGVIGVRDRDFLVQMGYNVALSDAWRLKAGITFLGGPRSSYLGQYRDNNYVNLQLRYSF